MSTRPNAEGSGKTGVVSKFKTVTIMLLIVTSFCVQVYFELPSLVATYAYDITLIHLKTYLFGILLLSFQVEYKNKASFYFALTSI